MNAVEIQKAEATYKNAVARVDRLAAEAAADGYTGTDAAHKQLDEALELADTAKEHLDDVKATAAARAKFEKQPLENTKQVALAAGGYARISVDEPDMYGPHSRSFLVDLYGAQLKGDLAAQERISRHHTYEVEKYAIATGTLGGIVPPQYLVDLYARAQRFGRVLADQIRHEDLPEQGMTVIIPRLPQGTTAAIQATESATVATQDVTETDLTVPIRTIAGYSPVSRQTLERAAYSEAILFEDLVARYHAALDTQLISGSGSSGQHLGLLNVSGVSVATISSWTTAGLWNAIVGENGLMAQVNTWASTVGAPADRIVMHPRRWGAILGLLDSSNRPLVVPAPNPGSFNTMGAGEASGYGLMGQFGGIPVYVDANIGTSYGAGTNEDRIFVYASQAPILFERPADPVTLAFEEQAGNALQIQLVCYGYSAAALGRFPAAIGIASGAGLT